MLLPSHRALWLNQELSSKIDDFIRNEMNSHPNFGNMKGAVGRGAIRYALSKPKELYKFLHNTADCNNHTKG